MTLLIGLDIGTTSVKAGLFEPSGRQLAAAGEEYRIDHPAPDRAEIDAETYWTATAVAVRRALGIAGVDSAPGRGDRRLQPGRDRRPGGRERPALGPALVWLDNRALAEARELAEQFDDADVYDRTGVPSITPTWTACKLLWWRRHEPGLFAAARRFLLVEDFVLHRLTGRFVTEGGVQSHVAALRHPQRRLVGRHARGGGDRTRAAARAGPARGGRGHPDERGGRCPRPAPGRAGGRRRDGPGRRGSGRREPRGRRGLGEHGRRPDAPGIRRSPRRRPDPPDPRLRPLGPGPLPLLPGLPDRRDGADLVPRPVRRGGGHPGRARGSQRLRPADGARGRGSTRRGRPDDAPPPHGGVQPGVRAGGARRLLRVHAPPRQAALRAGRARGRRVHAPPEPGAACRGRSAGHRDPLPRRRFPERAVEPDQGRRLRAAGDHARGRRRGGPRRCDDRRRGGGHLHGPVRRVRGDGDGQGPLRAGSGDAAAYDDAYGRYVRLFDALRPLFATVGPPR